LGPLSAIVAELFEELDQHKMLKCLRVLGSKIDNYDVKLIEKLFNKYTNPLFISQMYAQNQSFFMEFAKAWPQFLRNPALLSQLTKL